MSERRLAARVPSARRIGTGILEKHKLVLHKVGYLDGTAKCDAFETGRSEHLVHGVLFHISKQDETVLDRIEGLGSGYEKKDVSIKMRDGPLTEAFIYYATNIDPTLKPFDWYKEHVIRGARENDLPEHYIHAIEELEFNMDTNTDRRKKELSIYR